MRFPYAIAPATILGPLPKMVHKIGFTWKFYAFALMDLLGKKVPPTCLHVLPPPRTLHAFLLRNWLASFAFRFEHHSSHVTKNA